MGKKRHISPEYLKWKRKYPKYPGTEKCVELLWNAHGERIEIICHEIEQHSKTNPSELIEAVEREKNFWVRRILLGILDDIAAPRAIPIFTKILESGEEDEYDYAVRGLRRIDTKEARTILFKAGISSDIEKTKYHRAQ
jgi:hypothetical protein